MSRQELAEAINQYVWVHYQIQMQLDRTDIGKLENGEVRWPGEHRRAALRAILHASTDAELGLYIPRGTAHAGGPAEHATPAASLSGQGSMPWDVPGGGGDLPAEHLLLDSPSEVPVGLFWSPAAVADEFVAALELLTDSYRHADYQAGARHLATSLHHHLTAMLDLHGRARTGAIETRLRYAIMDAAQLAAWFAIDQQHYHEASRYGRLALKVTDDTGGQSTRMYLLGLLAYIRLHAKDGPGALRILTTADATSPQASPAVRSWILEAAGEAHAFSGDTAAGIRALHQAESLFERVHTPEVPSWLAFYNTDAHLLRLKGRCLMHLGQADDSVETLTEALRELPERFVRERSGTLIDLTLAHLRQPRPEVEQACACAAEAASLAAATGSGRNQRRLRAVLAELRPYTAVPAVQDLHHELLLR